MFTGIVEEIGRVSKISRGRHSAVLEIGAQKVLEHTKIGDSIAVNGICLTVTSLGAGSFTADVMHETLDRSALAALRSGDHVNLERAMPADGRFGGHMVGGHIDGTGRIVSIEKDDTAVWFTVQVKPELLRYVVEKGSIAMDGISLTVAKTQGDRFSVSAIPHTVRETVLHWRRPGELVNLETDMIGKYVEQLLHLSQKQDGRGGITEEFLTKYGF
ncbi:MAG: riboflavin synthase [Eubacterium sp.]|nr:riboflavin synthase [Eubacterium sp.]